MKGKEWREVGRRGGAGLRSEVFLLSGFLSAGVSFLKSQLDEGEEGAAVLPEKCFHLGESEAVEIIQLGGNAAGGKL